jgi:hypothetical protein
LEVHLSEQFFCQQACMLWVASCVSTCIFQFHFIVNNLMRNHVDTSSHYWSMIIPLFWKVE